MIAVVGAGPSGARAASLLAKHDRVVMFEEHSRVGLPVQCTGITTGYLSSLIPLEKDFVVNKVSRVRVFSPNNSFADFALKKPNIVLDRSAFDQFLVGNALDRGVELFKGHRFLRSSRKGGKVLMDFRGKYRHFMADALVGADGPFSPVAKSNGMFGRRSFVVGMQSRVKFAFEPDLVEFHLNRDFMGWVVPESGKVARVGISSSADPSPFFKAFIHKRAGNGKVLDSQSGFIPVYNPRVRAQLGNVFLVGDAATMVKATTYGGIIQGLMAAEELARAYAYSKDYEKLWKKRIGKDLWLGLLIRKKLDRFSNQDYNQLVGLVKKSSVRRIIEFYDRDFPSSFALRLLLSEPRFLKFLI